ncbi:adenylate/guanylate cyclase domain-containing protein [candidate division KSB1 bacterium]|nr:MAG: adenylate/guanylate cyclase domain-containing protein [candidate division KSB1 bacterium]MBC6951563.1 adenylate/guanylate cyclase domain-containing protein [candidate division KSB1 bacterium]MCE7945589.1 adenylate/guanylate cyclase domain-containing protein [Chlorobi bacterium CHB1]MDL1877534.1 adenylate/guanylate cyclase domain-containing protein [Cytophagia bacterium CHB2]
MPAPSYKLLAYLAGLNVSRAFALEPGRRYLLGSAEMEPDMLVFPGDRSLSRRQAWLEISGNKLRVERHALASQKLNADEAAAVLELHPGESFTAGKTVFRFLAEADVEPLPDRTYVFSSSAMTFATASHEFRSFITIIEKMPGLMKINESPADFLLALCRTLQAHIPGLHVSAWTIEAGDDAVYPSPIPAAESIEHNNAAEHQKPSRHLLQQALCAQGDECAVSVWHAGEREGVPPGRESLIFSGAQWAMCIAIALAERENFALYATGAHALPGDQINEVQRLFAALGAIAKQHLLAARARERLGQIGQFFSPALRKILFEDLVRADQALQPVEEEAVVCFFDLRGSSLLAEGRDVYAGQNAARQHFALLESILGNAANVIFETGGIVIDFQGDGILACWGVPPGREGAPEHPVEQALLAARQIVELMAEYDWPAIVTESGAAQRCGAGITCGKVLAGLFTAQGQNHTRLSKYAVIGRAVNQAARLEALTKKLGVPILVDGNVARQADNKKFLLRRICNLQPAGMHEVLAVHELVVSPQAGGTGIDENGIALYAAALAHFEHGDFAAAGMALREAPQDAVGRFLEAQITQQFKARPSPTWDGVINFSI